MKNVTTGAIAALLASTAMASAGGIDRSGQSVSILFEGGELCGASYGFVDPSVSGADPFSLDTGDMAPAYSLMAGGYKADLTDKISATVIFDQPYGASAAYTTGFYTNTTDDITAATTAELTSTAITALVGYDVSDNIVVYGGVSMQTMSATATIANPLFVYNVEADAQTGTGYAIGAAYQIPEMALRAALTYRSSITTDHTTLESFGAEIPVFIPSITTISTPESVTLDFQTGVNPKTLVFGSIRWVNWSEFEMAPATYPANPLVGYESDVVTYSLGVGRKLTENLSGALTVGYEASLGDIPSALAPTDGYFSVGAGLTYASTMLKLLVA